MCNTRIKMKYKLNCDDDDVIKFIIGLKIIICILYVYAVYLSVFFFFFLVLAHCNYAIIVRVVVHKFFFLYNMSSSCRYIYMYSRVRLYAYNICNLENHFGFDYDNDLNTTGCVGRDVQAFYTLRRRKLMFANTDGLILFSYYIYKTVRLERIKKQNI